MINHVTYHVPPGTLDDPDLGVFMSALGLREVPARDKFEHGWKVRWWAANPTIFGTATAPKLHLVEGIPEETVPSDAQDRLNLGHFCISMIGPSRLKALRESRWCERDSGSGRIWLRFRNLRVEVRP